ncbi:MAG: metal ABC transporter permease [Lachnospiraceae bacterium]|uniref:metal ABC transporter permease n=1 Tax=Falcatimonas sp. MSJ-15 TaxID=2841515 RepID=UPI001C10C856|nr:metal ABC transporter permease [Falcatimonas sp. MSJ-15]MBQ5735932.1 metal ABC transporter permease [Lachnospiraceae bacterium]MBU5468979.1 metal ABC transporter permease [Falcatimonas sp. MSJ-15]MEE0960811.1 metal ABC transporter permease [Lachnospiraceae bacterium]
MSTIIEIFSYPFMVRAIIVGSLVSLCAALLGVSLVLKRYSMIGDGLSHVGFGALSVAAAMNVAPLKIAIPVVIIAAFFLLRISSNSKIQGDAAIALISSSSIAAGVIVTSMTSGLNADVYSYMFGSILAMGKSDVFMSIVLSVIVLLIYVLFYNKIFSITFDQNFSKATGIKTDFYNTLISILTAVTIVVGMRIMGTMLISSLVIFPTLTSMRLFKSFKSVVISSAIISIICFTIGIIVSYIMNFPAGASIVAVNLVAFIVFVIIGKIRG